MIEIPIYFNTEDSVNIGNAGIEPTKDVHILRSMIFFNIDHIKPFSFMDNWVMDCSQICSGGIEYITPYTYDELKEILLKSK